MKEETFWDRTLPLIKAHGMSIKEFTRFSGFPYSTFRGWIYHKRVPHISDSNRIAFALGVTLGYLLNGKDRNVAALRLRELDFRKSAARIQALADEIQKEINLLKPLKKRVLT